MIRKSFSILFFCLWVVGLVAQTNGYDPVNPPNPEVRLLHKLTTAVTPVRAGSVNYSDSRFRMNEEVYVYTYGNENYRFKHWLDGDEVISTESSCYYRMPDRDVQLTAVYEYDPASPGHPYGMPGTLTLKASPSRAGYFNYNNKEKIQVGTELSLYAYANQSYTFKHWEYRGEIISNDFRCNFTMPEGAAELVAVFEYNPQSPKNPGTNAWDQQGGELIIDDFQAGELSSTIWNVTNGDYEGLYSLIVAGHISDYDIGSITQFPFKEVDFSRCADAKNVPSWTYENNQNLTTISLPSSINKIEWYAFYECQNLATVNCYANIPPTLEDGAFAGINKEQLVIYVPAASVDLYKNAPGWMEFPNILPFQTQVVALELDMPEGVNIDDYKNMFIELVNAKSGQRIRYVITDRLAYSFQNLMQNTTWNAYIKNSKDQVVGKIEGIELKEENLVREFESLKVPQTIRATVVTPDETDVTNDVQIRWLDAAGTYIGQGSSISGILPLEGTTVTIRVTLPQLLAMQYELPEDVVYEVKETDNVETLQLKALPTAQITGRVCNTMGEPINGATVTLSQTLNGRYGKATTAKTNADGSYSFDAFDAPTTITAFANNHVSKSSIYEKLVLDNGIAAIEDLLLKNIEGVTINVGFTYTMSAVSGEQGEVKDFFEDYQNVAYTIRNKTTEQEIKEFNVQYPQIVLMEEVEAGNELEITAISKTGAFKSVQSNVKVNSMKLNVTFDIKQLGQLSATFVSSENKAVNGILYDGNGKYVKSGVYENAALMFTDLEDGRYTLVSMGSSKLFNTIYDLYKFSQAGLVKNRDYTTSTVQIQSGVITSVKVPFVPLLDETRLYYTGANTSFAVNKAQVTAGSYVTLSGRIDFKETFANEVSDLRFVVDLPAACNFVDQSVMVGNSIGDYTSDGQRLTIPFTVQGDRIRFCVIPTAGGDYAPSAYVQFKYDGKDYTQPIGQAAFTVKDLSINVPSTTPKAQIPVNGTAIGKSKVQVYDNGVLIGETTALANGVWSTTCDLDNPEDESEHPIYAKVTTQAGLEMLSETKTVKVDASAIQVENVTMYYTNPEVNAWRGQNYVLVYNFQNPSTSAYRYVYYIYNRTFTFTINLSDNEKADSVVLKVKTGDGKWHALPATYNGNRGLWFVSAQFGDMYDGIVPVNVAVDFYVLYGGVRVLFTCPTSGYPDNDVPIDPSGYVYEAVPSNRLEGVMASCYYKETVENVYGDKTEVVRLWDDAEYAQENPLFTDEDGMYRWDVPQGLWQVKFEKEGYETAYSEWLPVPPPQLDVNIAMTQATPPEIASVKAYKGGEEGDDGVEVEFDKYMLAETLTPENFYVTNNDVMVHGNIELLNPTRLDEENPESPLLASRVKFVPEGEVEWDYNTKPRLFVRTGVKSYAGVSQSEEMSQEFDVEKKVRSIDAEAIKAVLYGQSRTLQVSANPGEAAKSKKMRVRVLSKQIADITANNLEPQDDESYLITLDENGATELTINGELPGSTTLLFSIEGTKAEGKTVVNVEQAPSLETNSPRASRASGTLYRGTRINLLSDDDDAKIWYTLDGTEPTTESTPYDRPIVINDDNVTIKAIAQKDGFDPSEVVEYNYFVKQSKQNVALEGWSWISHGMNRNVKVDEFSDKVLEIKTLTKGVIRDEQLGLFGNLKELVATEAYKVKVAENDNVQLSGDAFNATSGVINLEEGWNWIGYPVEDPMSLSEALANMTPSEGDMITGKSGHAYFQNGEWTGSLEIMEPGQGYMIKVASDCDLLYNTSIVSKAAAQVRGRLNINKAPWSVDVHQYPDVMPMCAQLFLDETLTDADKYTVAAFADTECRGLGKNVKGVIFMNVQGEGKENITFLAFNNQTGDIMEIDETVTFHSDNVGTFSEPMALHLGAKTDGIKKHYDKMDVWPAVATNEVNVSLGGLPIERLTITSTDGKMQRVQTSGATQQTVNVNNLPAGIYIVAAKSGNNSFYKKIVKVNQ